MRKLSRLYEVGDLFHLTKSKDPYASTLKILEESYLFFKLNVHEESDDLTDYVGIIKRHNQNKFPA